MGKTHNLQRGFTIIELLIVVIIIALLIGIVAVGYGAVQRNAKDTSVLSDIDAVEGAQTRYGLKNGVAGKAWYSGSGIDTDLGFTPSSENVIDVVVSSGEYCIRGYNPSGNKNTIDNSFTRGSTDDACELLAASVAAGGTGDAPIIGWWKLNGTSIDASGNGYNGAVLGASIATGQQGTTNTAYDFSTGYIDLTNSFWSGKFQDMPGNTHNFSLSAWVRPSSYPAENATIVGQRYQDAMNFGMKPNGKLYLRMDDTALGGASTTISLNTWHFVTAAFTSTGSASSSVTYYLDGNADGTELLWDGSGVGSGYNDLFIGWQNRSGVSASSYFPGLIDDVRIYNKVLNLAEIQALYAAGAK